jgi:hypothetical protein
VPHDPIAMMEIERQQNRKREKQSINTKNAVHHEGVHRYVRSSSAG